MSISEIRQSAFGKWLLGQPRENARLHLWELLHTGPADNMAWNLLEAVFGEKSLPSPLSAAINRMLDALEVVQ